MIRGNRKEFYGNQEGMVFADYDDEVSTDYQNVEDCYDGELDITDHDNE